MIQRKFLSCKFSVGSWMKTGEEMNYNTEKVKLISSRSTQNNEWKLLSANSKVNIGKYDVAPNETYPSITFSFFIERHSAYHLSGIIVPALVLLICNLTVLWMMPGCIERFVLCVFNLFSHFLYLEFIYWMLPHCGDSVPNALIFFRDSQILSTFLLIQSIVVKTIILKADEKPHMWIQSIVSSATSNHIGEFLLTSATPKIEDAEDLVESVKKLSSDQTIWFTFCKLIDRVLFFAFLVLYIFMFVALLPEGYLTVNYDPIESA
jgi:Neurotransmitter-gated ion-channel ligand binding domain